MFVESDTCFVLYTGKSKSGALFRNTEFFQLKDGQIRSVEYFGLAPGATPAQPREAKS